MEQKPQERETLGGQWQAKIINIIENNIKEKKMK